MTSQADMRELKDAVKNLVDIYFNRVPAPDVDREQLADCITEGLSDELLRLYAIERSCEPAEAVR